MANTKISQLTALTNPTGNEEFVYAYNGSNGKITLDTMKTYSTSGSQPTLVSGTNIKTINNQDILGSGDLTVSGVSSYDCVVDASGNGDYTTLGAALTAGKHNIFIKNGNYTESKVTLTDASFDVTGESTDGVVLNYTDINCIEVNYTNSTASDVLDAKFRNIQFNISYTFAVGEHYANVFLGTLTDVDTVIMGEMSNCMINADLNGSSGYGLALYMFSGMSGETKSRIYVHDCAISMTGDCASFYDTRGIKRAFLYENCYFKTVSTVYAAFRIYGPDFSHCVVRVVGDSSGGTGADTQLNVDGANNCSLNLSGSSAGNRGRYFLTNCSNCDCTFSRVEDEEYGIVKSTSISEWQPSTAYSVGDFVSVRNDNYIRKCTTAHTSSDDIYNDEANWTSCIMNSIRNCSGIKFDSGGSLYLGGNIDDCDINFGTGVLCGGAVITSSKIGPHQDPLKVCGIQNVISGNTIITNSGLSYQDANTAVITSNIIRGYSSSGNPSITKLGTGGKAVVEHNVVCLYNE